MARVCIGAFPERWLTGVVRLAALAVCVAGLIGLFLVPVGALEAAAPSTFAPSALDDEKDNKDKKDEKKSPKDKRDDSDKKKEEKKPDEKKPEEKKKEDKKPDEKKIEKKPEEKKPDEKKKEDKKPDEKKPEEKKKEDKKPDEKKIEKKPEEKKKEDKKPEEKKKDSDLLQSLTQAKVRELLVPAVKAQTPQLLPALSKAVDYDRLPETVTYEPSTGVFKLVAVPGQELTSQAKAEFKDLLKRALTDKNLNDNAVPTPVFDKWWGNVKVEPLSQSLPRGPEKLDDPKKEPAEKPKQPCKTAEPPPCTTTVTTGTVLYYYYPTQTIVSEGTTVSGCVVQSTPTVVTSQPASPLSSGTVIHSTTVSGCGGCSVVTTPAQGIVTTIPAQPAQVMSSTQGTVTSTNSNGATCTIVWFNDVTPATTTTTVVSPPVIQTTQISGTPCR